MRISLYPLLFLSLFLKPLTSFSKAELPKQYFVQNDDDALLQKVYNKLKKSLNVSSRDLPLARLTDREDNIGSYKKEGDETLIEIEQVAFDVCKTFGPYQEHAIAYLLGHELTHFYQQHHWNLSNFSTVFFIHSIEKTQEIDKHELDADQYGLFLTYLAGYDYEILVQIVPDLIQRLFEKYAELKRITQINESIFLRQDIIKEVKPMVVELIDLYEAANLLYAAGNAEAAFQCNSLLAKSINLSEVQNNKGVTGLQVVYDSLIIDTTPDEHLFFQYPTAINLDFKLEDYRDSSQEIFEEVITALTEANRIDPHNPNIVLNLACAYDLDGRTHLAKKLILPYKASGLSPSLNAKYLTMEAIIAAHENDFDLAKQKFELAAQSAENHPALTHLIQENQRIMNGQRVYESYLSPKLPKDTIEGHRVNGWRSFLKDVETPYEMDNGDFLYVQKLKRSFRLLFLSGTIPTKIHYTKDTDDKTNQGIGVRSSYDELQKTYAKNAHHVLLHYGGYYAVYPELGLIFNLNHSHQVVAWATYYVASF